MKSIALARDVNQLYSLRNLQLKSDWCKATSRCIAGEWVLYTSATESYIGYTNPNIERASHYLVEKISKSEIKKYSIQMEDQVAQQMILKNLNKAIDYRLNELPYGDNARMVYGSADYLPGLIIDSYVNMVLVQVNTAGIDRFRNLLKSELQKRFPLKEIVFLDHANQRKKEELPQYEMPNKKCSLHIQDGMMTFEIAPELWQKNGYYYDHRDNRVKFYQKLTELKLDMNNGLDLFCYLGSWGITALLAGVKSVDFVDQANLGAQLEVNLQKNCLGGRGVFHHGDVFNFLDNKIQDGATYEVIISDPPSFAKSIDKKPQALQGYKKLHKKILQLLKPGGIVCFASCTHYVSPQEFESTIKDAATSCKRNLKLIDTGVQALDHPFVNFNDKSYYLKYYAYLSI